MRRLPTLLAVAALLAAADPSITRADEPAYALGAYATADNFAATGGLEGRLRLSRAQLMLRAEGGRARNAYLGGYAIEDSSLARLSVETRIAAGSIGPARFGAHLSVGARFHQGGEGNVPDTTSRAIEVELAFIATLPIRQRGTLQAGVRVPFSIEIVAPGTDGVVNDIQGALLSLGGGVALGERLWLHGRIDTGGIFGADGDAGKFLFRGTLAIRGLFGSTTRDWLAF